MTEHGSTRLGADHDVEDPGRDPKGIGGPPRNPLGAGADQDSGRGAPPTPPPTDDDDAMVPMAPDDDRRDD
ncbi:hypothetical protein E9529_05545 [Blastococcus sp. KM273128]|uniref:hypothetical protein n=1 Tax=Blastococcus sp. KM273128 TaxID=2570314 RepID=UPI001F3D636A|nr:hypothetical protein [Blastococcus sp. KM273128]MCF6743746.1 hypothetical protein [Blastococcus sp. KM273128]